MIRDGGQGARYPIWSGCLLLLWSAPAGAVVRHVPSEYPTIAAGLAAAVTGDVVEVSCGTYFERGLVMQSGVTLRSESGDPSCVTIDGSGLGRVIFCQGVSSETRFEGLTIQAGATQGYNPFQFGAGMLCWGGAEPVIENCVFTGNRARYGQGGGLACVDSSPLAVGCVFLGNQASGEGVEFSAGGAVTALRSGARFEACTFELNTGWDGAAFYADQSPVAILSCDFLDNAAEHVGGAIYVRSGNLLGEATISSCLLDGNTAATGTGGIECYPYASPSIADCVIRNSIGGGGGAGGLGCGNHSSPMVRNVLFMENSSSSGPGGGVAVGSSSNPRFTRCLFLRNFASSGGGVLVGTGAEPIFENCTFVENASSGWGTFAHIEEASPTFERCIVAGHPAGELVLCFGRPGIPWQPTFTCVNIFGNAGGDWTGCIADYAGLDGNFSADPLFCDAQTDDFTLDRGSPCLPGLHPEGYDCGLIGAFDRGCGATASLEATWGSVKSRFGRP